MYSNARIAGHPIHPMWVAAPIALFTSTIGLELAHVRTHDALYYRAAMIADVAGVILALLAVVPGAIERFSLPERSRARVTGDTHALFSVLTTALFALGGVILDRGWTKRSMVDGVDTLDAHLPLALGMVGFVSMATAALLGYARVQTHHAGVSTRTALR